MSVGEQVRAAIQHRAVEIRHDELDAALRLLERKLDADPERLQFCSTTTWTEIFDVCLSDKLHHFNTVHYELVR